MAVHYCGHAILSHSQHHHAVRGKFQFIYLQLDLNKTVSLPDNSPPLLPFSTSEPIIILITHRMQAAALPAEVLQREAVTKVVETIYFMASIIGQQVI